MRVFLIVAGGEHSGRNVHSPLICLFYFFPMQKAVAFLGENIADKTSFRIEIIFQFFGFVFFGSLFEDRILSYGVERIFQPYGIKHLGIEIHFHEARLQVHLLIIHLCLIVEKYIFIIEKKGQGIDGFIAYSCVQSLMFSTFCGGNTVFFLKRNAVLCEYILRTNVQQNKHQTQKTAYRNRLSQSFSDFNLYLCIRFANVRFFGKL